MNWVRSSAVLIVCLAGCAAHAQKAGTVDAVRPTASIEHAKDLRSAQKGEEISWNDLLRTGKQGRVRVLLADQSLISVGLNSQVRVVRQSAQSTQSSLELAFGKVRMRVAKPPDGQHFELRSATAVAGVIGTDFGADASVPGSTHFLCLEGEVRISNIDPKVPGTVTCRGGHMTDVKAGQPPTEPTPAPPDHMQEWRTVNEPEYQGDDDSSHPH